MRVFACQNCGQLLHFENSSCMRCGFQLGFLPPSLTLSALQVEGDRAIAMADGAAWLPLTVAVNSLNRSMGQPDLYPFALTPVTVEKLRFIHKLVHGLD